MREMLFTPLEASSWLCVSRELAYVSVSVRAGVNPRHLSSVAVSVNSLASNSLYTLFVIIIAINLPFIPFLLSIPATETN
jgi:hypothetical protein